MSVGIHMSSYNSMNIGKKSDVIESSSEIKYMYAKLYLALVKKEIVQAKIIDKLPEAKMMNPRNIIKVGENFIILCQYK